MLHPAIAVLLSHTVDKTAPNVAFEYGGDGNGEEDLKEIEIEEKKHLLDSAVSTRSCTE